MILLKLKIVLRSNSKKVLFFLPIRMCRYLRNEENTQKYKGFPQEDNPGNVIFMENKYRDVLLWHFYLFLKAFLKALLICESQYTVFKIQKVSFYYAVKLYTAKCRKGTIYFNWVTRRELFLNEEQEGG